MAIIIVFLAVTALASADGAHPLSELLRTPKGTLFGTTALGGIDDSRDGVVEPALRNESP